MILFSLLLTISVWLNVKDYSEYWLVNQEQCFKISFFEIKSMKKGGKSIKLLFHLGPFFS